MVIDFMDAWCLIARASRSRSAGGGGGGGGGVGVGGGDRNWMYLRIGIEGADPERIRIGTGRQLREVRPIYIYIGARSPTCCRPQFFFSSSLFVFFSFFFFGAATTYQRCSPPGPRAIGRALSIVWCCWRAQAGRQSALRIEGDDYEPSPDIEKFKPRACWPSTRGPESQSDPSSAWSEAE